MEGGVQYEGGLPMDEQEADQTKNLATDADHLKTEIEDEVVPKT